MKDLHVADAIDEIFALLRRSNKYIDETMPWALAKDETKQARLGLSLIHIWERQRHSAHSLPMKLQSRLKRDSASALSVQPCMKQW